MFSAFPIPTCQNVSPTDSIQIPRFYDSALHFLSSLPSTERAFEDVHRLSLQSAANQPSLPHSLPGNAHDVEPRLNIFLCVSGPRFLSRNGYCISTSGNKRLKSKMNWDVLSVHEWSCFSKQLCNVIRASESSILGSASKERVKTAGGAVLLGTKRPSPKSSLLFTGYRPGARWALLRTSIPSFSMALWN